eukprot:sb/3476151/
MDNLLSLADTFLLNLVDFTKSVAETDGGGKATAPGDKKKFGQSLVSKRFRGMKVCIDICLFEFGSDQFGTAVSDVWRRRPHLSALFENQMGYGAAIQCVRRKLLSKFFYFSGIAQPNDR